MGGSPLTLVVKGMHGLGSSRLVSSTGFLVSQLGDPGQVPSSLQASVSSSGRWFNNNNPAS